MNVGNKIGEKQLHYIQMAKNKINRIKFNKTEFEKWFQGLIDERSTNFTDSIKVNTPTTHSYAIEDCQMITNHTLHSLKTGGVSGGEIYMGFMDTINKHSPNVVLKIFGIDKGLTSACLNAEWNIYTYIIPFMFFCRLTPCVLFPTKSAVCQSKYIVLKAIMTPFIKDSLADILYSSDNDTLDMTNIFFQLVYTIAAFSRLGMRHNDCHADNMRIVPSQKKPFKIHFRLQEKSVYATIPNLVVINDFDRTSINLPISKATKLKNPCTEEKGHYCDVLHQCNTNIGGRKDMLIIIFNVFNFLEQDMRQYLYDYYLTTTEWATTHLKKHVNFDKKLRIKENGSNYSNFVFRNLPDSELVKSYPDVDSILNNKTFLNLCFKSNTLKEKTTEPNKYTTYCLYKVNIDKEYSQFKSNFYK